MRIAFGALLLVLGILQYNLWLGERGIPDVWQRAERLRALEAKVERLEARNRRLRAEVEDLRREGQAIVERAREDLGMIREGEIFIRMVQPPGGAREGGAGAQEGG